VVGDSHTRYKCAASGVLSVLPETHGHASDTRDLHETVALPIRRVGKRSYQIHGTLVISARGEDRVYGDSPTRILCSGVFVCYLRPMNTRRTPGTFTKTKLTRLIRRVGKRPYQILPAQR
jgi:hypothetical protein